MLEHDRLLITAADVLSSQEKIQWLNYGFGIIFEWLQNYKLQRKIVNSQPFRPFISS
jgi:hypothetical protein